MTLMVIFGAGASFDSSANHPVGDPLPNRPPVANSLFDDRREFHEARNTFPQIQALIPQLMPHGNRSVEQTLQKFSDQAAGDPIRKQQLLAMRFYLQGIFGYIIPLWLRAIGGFTNYDALLEQIRYHRRKGSSEPVVLVTFNYDTLLEDALHKQFKMTFEMLDDYIRNPDYQVFKLHGSQNWGRYVEGTPTMLFQGNRDPRGRPDLMIEHVERITCSTTFGVYDSVARGGNFSGPPLFPAIAIPVTTKTDSTFECPANHLAQLAALIPRVTKLVTIGWRGQEQHFLGLLRALKPGVKVMTVAQSIQAAEETLGLIKAVCQAAGGDRGLAGFSDVCRDELLEEFLSTGA
jgi:hypothetical protein